MRNTLEIVGEAFPSDGTPGIDCPPTTPYRMTPGEDAWVSQTSEHKTFPTKGRQLLTFSASSISTQKNSIPTCSRKKSLLSEGKTRVFWENSQFQRIRSRSVDSRHMSNVVTPDPHNQRKIVYVVENGRTRVAFFKATTTKKSPTHFSPRDLNNNCLSKSRSGNVVTRSEDGLSLASVSESIREKDLLTSRKKENLRPHLSDNGSLYVKTASSFRGKSHSIPSNSHIWNELTDLRTEPASTSSLSNADDIRSVSVLHSAASNVRSDTDQVKMETSKPRAISTSPGKRINFRSVDAVKDRLREMYISRRAYSAAPGNIVLTSSRTSLDRRNRKAMKVIAKQETLEVDAHAVSVVSKMFRKFRLVIRIVITLIRLKAAIVVNSLDGTVRSATEIQWRTLFGEQETEKLAFNKSLFSAERVTTTMPRWAQSILDISPEERSEQDCRRLHALLRGMRSFDKFTERIQLSLCRAFTYISVGESRIVLRRGHVGHNFYFVYSGSLFVNVQDTDSEGNPFIKTEAILGRGDSFGELALLQDIKRTATVSVREKCELLVVDKDVFAQVCPKIFERELMEKQSFVSRLPLFSGKWWSVESIRSLCMEAQIQEYKVNKIVVENNTIEDWLYICMEGRCQIIRCLSVGEEGTNRTPSRSREPSLVLSEEILELLAKTVTQPVTRQERRVEMSEDRGWPNTSTTSATISLQCTRSCVKYCRDYIHQRIQSIHNKVIANSQEDESGQKSADSKETLLSSLGLEYITTGKMNRLHLLEKHMAYGRVDMRLNAANRSEQLSSHNIDIRTVNKRRGVFIEEIENEERKKAMLASSGPRTLTALIAQQLSSGKTGVVYLNVGSLDSGGVFDMGSLVKAPSRRAANIMLLVSSGARILRIKKSSFFALASPQALEHARTLLSKQTLPSELTLRGAYQEKLAWDAYKAGLVRDVIRARDQRTVPFYRTDVDRSFVELKPRSSTEVSQGPVRRVGVEKLHTNIAHSFSRISESDASFLSPGSAVQGGNSRENCSTSDLNNEGKELPKLSVPEVQETFNQGFRSAHNMASTPRAPVGNIRRAPRPTSAIIVHRPYCASKGRPVLHAESQFVTRRHPMRSKNASASIVQSNQ